MREANKLLRNTERNWLLLIDGVDKKTAEGIALNKSEDYYTQVVQYDSEKERGWAVYTYWRYHGDDDKDLPKIFESKEWQIKRLNYVIEHHEHEIKNHEEKLEIYKQELSSLS